MTLGKKILSMRKARGWSQEDLAEQIGVSRQAVSRWESDGAKPDTDKLIALCDRFGVSADYLLGLIAENESSQPPKVEKAETPGLEVVQPVRAEPWPSQSHVCINRKLGGWMLFAVSGLLMILHFILKEALRENLLWLFWLPAAGAVTGLLMAPCEKWVQKPQTRKTLGWIFMGLSFLPVIVFIGYFGLLHGDWEWEIIWPTVAVTLVGSWLIIGRQD